MKYSNYQQLCMAEKQLLLNPGPVPVREEVMQRMTEPMISHRSDEFEDVYSQAQDGMNYVFERSTVTGRSSSSGGESLILNGTATMAMEAVVSNIVNDRSEVVSVVNGKFGRRFARIAERHAGNVRRVEADWGESVALEHVQESVTSETDLVTMVHNETSTGILNPVWGVGRILEDYDALFAVDAVTSLGGDVFCIDNWNVDLVVTGSQKALETPPGLSAIYMKNHVRNHIKGEDAPFYEDLDWHIRKSEQNQTPFTSAVPLFRSLAKATEVIQEESLPSRIHRHHRQSRAFRRGFESLGLEIFPNPTDHTVLSNTVTAIKLPQQVRDGNVDSFFSAVQENGVSISGGQAHLGGEIFRVSNMGSLSSNDIVKGVNAVGDALNTVGFDADVDTALSKVKEQLN